MKLKLRSLSTLIFMISMSCTLFAVGKVYLVLGSDTAIWDGMGTDTFNDTYNQSLFTDQTMNAFEVMSSEFRFDLTDSYGTRLKMTWWMMGGNIFRYATNNNFPVANTMTPYLMQKFYGDFIDEIGDEISIHYHTFAWTDYDQDGKWYWNQAKGFSECLDDFDYTLCQYLLEENIFPVSFRSGWHFMDDDWQHYLNDLLPYSLHDDWPNKRTYDPEPIDNIYDWSRSPSAFIPWHPSIEDYRSPGDGPGWNVRSTHFSTALSKNLLDSIFYQASIGNDQLACLWGHLPETDFPANIELINTAAHQMEIKYPSVKFRYCSATEAMQYWQGKADTIAPVITFEEIQTGDQVTFRITSDEPIFQKVPFVAMKDIYGNYSKLACQQTSTNVWETTTALLKSSLAKVGVAVSDSLGNQTKKFINYIPDDIFVDNSDEGYQEISGTWNSYTAPVYTWGVNARHTQLTATDTIKTEWHPTINRSGLYNIMFQAPKIDNPAIAMTFKVFSGTQCIDTITVTQALSGANWNYITTANLTAGQDNYLLMEVPGANQSGKTVAVDVVKFSAMISDYNLVCPTSLINFGDVSQLDTAYYDLTLTNTGTKHLEIESISTNSGNIILSLQCPTTIPPMSSIQVTIKLYVDELGSFIDTISINSNDLGEPIYRIPISANITTHFLVVDNEDTGNYSESGNWYYSVAQAYGPTSRYATLNQSPYAYANYIFTIKKDGIYDLYEIVPTTINASDDALYIVNIDNTPVNSTHINQNTGSGNWVKVTGNYNFHKNDIVKIRVLDTGQNTNSGAVLRADAIKLSWVAELGQGISDRSNGLPERWALDQNYPNPFNSETTIRYAVPKSDRIRLIIYNSLGQIVQILTDRQHQPGYYSVNFNSDHLSSGIYFYRLIGDDVNIVKKLMLIK
ncbi:MAG: T9SS type A sorting domain-containing protein [Candidatus Neomarinimicrobiota bacterium]